MTRPISVDTELLNSESFQAFRRMVARALDQYIDGGAANFPLGLNLTKSDQEISESLLNAHPQGQIILEALLGATSGDASKIDLLARLLEVAEAENAEMARFDSDTPGGRPNH